ncbi:MAG: hypothetical protein KQH83_12675 [Actinobacteria bacterium]|nr:hypothetical protein [Actinomycetota bacterium]
MGEDRRIVSSCPWSLLLALLLTAAACSGGDGTATTGTTEPVASTVAASTTTTPPATSTTAATPPGSTTTTTEPVDPYAGVVKVASVRGEPPYDWLPEDVKLLDPWGDASSDGSDLIALYQRGVAGGIEIRADIFDLSEDDSAAVLVGLDWSDGGRRDLEPVGGTGELTIEWDLLIMVSGGRVGVFDDGGNDLSDRVVASDVDSQLDFVAVELAADALDGWDGEGLVLQAATAASPSAPLDDRTDPSDPAVPTGRAKLILNFMNGMTEGHPSAIGWYDGFDIRPGQSTAGEPGSAEEERTGERRGLRYLLDGIERYRLPLTWGDLRFDLFPTNEFLGINDRLAYLAAEGLFSPLMVVGYGHYMSWQPDDVDALAFSLAEDLWREFGFTPARVAFPYEGLVTAGDIGVLKQAGYEAAYGIDQYRYWFGWIDDWSDQAAVRDDIESLRKIHLIDGMPFFFNPRIGNYQGFLGDERWGGFEWPEEYDEYEGTDGGLHWMWRRILHDMAIDEDQEQYFEIGTDILLTPWLFPEVADANLGWLAAHPWIEVTTYESLLDRGWEPVDHGTLDLDADDLLIRYPYPDPATTYYNEYFPLHYYGGVSDGHASFIPAGTEIESYYDYVPYLAGGEPIPSGRIMGDGNTPGSIVYETLANLRGAPDNQLGRLAWLSYLLDIGEQTFHDMWGPLGPARLGNGAKVQAAWLGQVNKLVAAAEWADQASVGALTPDTVVATVDVDLDGEDEYTMSNDRVFAIFENDGGRLESAYAYDPAYGAVQIVAPVNQYLFLPDEPVDSHEGEIAVSRAWPDYPDGAFVEDANDNGHTDFDYSVFDAYTVFDGTIGSRVLMFAGDAGYTKTFSLQGDTLCAEYDGDDSLTFHLGVSMTANTAAMFTRDWADRLQRIETAEGIGWQSALGGAGLFSQTAAGQEVTFLDSAPAAEEMRSPDDPETVPSGYWEHIGHNRFWFWDVHPGTYCLVLSAAPAAP